MSLHTTRGQKQPQHHQKTPSQTTYTRSNVEGENCQLKKLETRQQKQILNMLETRNKQAPVGHT
jgi:hypothetical protein